MKAVDIIIKKRDKQELSKEEIDFFVQGFTKGEIPDYQISAWAMAVLLNGMTDEETTNLTLSMAHSGEILDLSEVVPIAVDKHSTGGVGDKTTFVVTSMVSACGLAVGKMSGRGLGFSGGTLDKIESIPGFRCALSPQEFKEQLRSIGLVLAGQSISLAPADGILYPLRDVTGTVQSLPLIASSVMSKKIAGGAQAIVLDVKIGHGAFMKTLSEAQKLAKLMVAIGKLSKRKVVAVLSDMNQPLGNAVGNALELREAIDTLQGNGPQDFTEHCVVLASHMLVIGKKADNLKHAREIVLSSIVNGQAFEKFRAMVKYQGGKIECVDNPEKLPSAQYIEQVYSDESGYMQEINAREVGETAVDLGAGRATKSDSIDLSVGMVIHHKVGDNIHKGDLLFTIHANDKNKMHSAIERLQAAHKISQELCQPLPLFYDVIE